MGKGTDKLYITHSEWASSDQYSASAGAGVRGGSENANLASFRRLPYNFCALSLQPFSTPVCTANGVVFDHENIIRWLINHDTNPTDGTPLKQNDLIKLTFAKNDADEFVDPVTFKVFTDNTHIVAIRHGDSANVFAYDTVERLNFKGKIWRDLVSDEEFGRKDVITLQDPQNLESRDLNKFRYLKEGEDTGIAKEEASINTSAMGNAVKILKAKEAVARSRAERAQKGNPNPSQSNGGTLVKSIPKQSSSLTTKSTPFNASVHTTGRAAASFTSTGMTPVTSGSLALLTDEEYLLKPKRVKHLGYARIHTSVGPLTLSLHPEFAPKAVWNFISLAKKSYYDKVIFHRNIRNFMIQTGDPTGTGRGGSSTWNKNFEDELEGPLKFDQRGMVGMANKGKNMNGSQFFVTYREAKHLQGKHTIFAKMVSQAEDAESWETLKRMENVSVDADNRPLEEIRMLRVDVFVDPFEEFWRVKREGEEGERKKKEEEDGDRTTWTGKRIRRDGTVEEAEDAGVGKYLKAAMATRPADEDEIVEFVDDDEPEPPKKKVKGGGGFGNFDGW